MQYVLDMCWDLGVSLALGMCIGRYIDIDSPWFWGVCTYTTHVVPSMCWEVHDSCTILGMCWKVQDS